MKVRIAILLLLSIGSQAGGALLKGVILSNELSGPPMPDVGVDAVDGTNPTVSDSFGKFEFVFPNKEPGETIQLIIDHAERVVVNFEDLILNLPKYPEADTVTVLLCEGERYDEMRLDFCHIKIDMVPKKTFDRSVLKLQDK